MTLSRRNVIIAAVAGTWLLLLLLTFFLVKSAQQKQQTQSQEQQQSPDTSPTRRQATEQEKANLLINKSEIEKAQQDFNAKTGALGSVQKKTYKFNYEISPDLQRKLNANPSPSNKKVLGVTTVCNISGAPSSVYVYDLKNHYTADEATNLAKEYGVISPVYSLTTDTGFQYQFTNKDNGAFFSLYEASGKYKYHIALATVGAALDINVIKQTADTAVSAHKLNYKLGPPTSIPSGQDNIFIYKKTLDNFKIVDENTVRNVIGGDPCAVAESPLMSTVEVQVKQDGKISDILNNTRSILGSYKATRISLDEAMKMYATSQPFDPIIIPPASTVDTGTVSVDAAVLAYYDAGPNFGQLLYTPVYIAFGTAKAPDGSSAQVVSFFPAVSATEMLDKGLIKTVPKPGSASSQQQGVLPFATPTLKVPPQPPAMGPVSGPGCPGNLVDYTVQCSVAGRDVCAGVFSSPSSSDPLNACSSGCKDKTATVTVVAGESPCQTFVKQNNVTGQIRGYDGSRNGNSSVAPGQQVSCALSACPC